MVEKGVNYSIFYFDHDLKEMEFSNPAYLEELEKRMILKKKIVQIGPSVQVLQNWAQKYFIYFCRKMVVFVVFCLLLFLLQFYFVRF